MNVKPRLGDFIMNLADSILELEASGCSLCRLFASLAPSKEEDEQRDVESNIPLHLRAFSAAKASIAIDATKFPGPDVTVLGVVNISVKDAKSGRNGAFSRTSASLKKTGYLYLTQPKLRSMEYGVRIICPKLFNVTEVPHKSRSRTKDA
jgi:hypothetical protein